MAVRYSAMLATALDYAQGDAAARVAAWRQLADILAQGSDDLDVDVRREAFGVLAGLTREVPVAQRRLASASLAGRVADLELIHLFAGDAPAVAAPMLSKLVIGDAAWQSLIPTIPAESRNILRNRRDLPDGAARLLARYATADRGLPPPPHQIVEQAPEDGAAIAPGDGAAPGATPILDLVHRIAEYQLQKDDDDRPAFGDPRSELFAFETDDEGTIAWVDGVPRAAVIGISLAEAAAPGGAGVDAAAAGAWRRRGWLGPCRLWVAGESPVSGDWTIEASPLFNPRNGRFVGYRGHARRPQSGERASTGPSRSADVGADSVRQLVHELRTPLNAIQGFASMIDEQMLGPAAAAYRAQAQAIVLETERLVTLIDDLDLAARLDAGRSEAVTTPVVLAVAVTRAADEQRSVLARRGITVRIDSGEDRGHAASPGATDRPGVTDRIVKRLLAAVAAVAADGSTLHMSVDVDADYQTARVARPATLYGLETRVLLDPDFEPDGAWPDASLLGLGFTLRLCARLASEQGGRLEILPDCFQLTLPSPAPAAYIAR